MRHDYLKRLEELRQSHKVKQAKGFHPTECRLEAISFFDTYKEIKNLESNSKNSDYLIHVDICNLARFIDESIELGFYEGLEVAKILENECEIEIDEPLQDELDITPGLKAEVDKSLERFKHYDYGELTIFEDEYNSDIITNITTMNFKQYSKLGGRYATTKGNILIYKDFSANKIRIVFENNIMDF